MRLLQDSMYVDIRIVFGLPSKNLINILSLPSSSLKNNKDKFSISIARATAQKDLPETKNVLKLLKIFCTKLHL